MPSTSSSVGRYTGSEGVVMTSHPREKPTSVREELDRRLSEIPGVVRRPSRWGHASAVHVGDREIAHFHGDQRLDVRLTKERIREYRSENAFDERVSTGGSSADWVTVRVLEARDIPLALQLIQDAAQANA